MSPLEIALAMGSSLATGLGVWYWAKDHSHPELVHRNEFTLLQTIIQSNHESVLRELSALRDTVDRHSRR